MTQLGSLYDLLEVSTNATFEEIEDSYHRIVSYLDTGSLAIYSMIEEDEATRMRSAVDEAYRTLSDPDRRTAYDRALIDSGVDYPSVIVPELHSDTNVTVGRVATEPPPTDTQEPQLHREKDELPTSRPLSPIIKRAEPVAAPASGRRRGRLVPSIDIELTPDTEFSGALMRRLRESADATLKDVADITKISKHYLGAIEENDYSALPAAVYVRGFVSEYARALGLDPQKVAKSYMALYKRYKGEGESQ